MSQNSINNQSKNSTEGLVSAEKEKGRKSNRLINEQSPYLLQHAFNPVDWYPWGEEAFQEAKKQDKPLLLSIGYSTCHWCHVMERESFEDFEIASLMNDNFVNVKVDREERPDIDRIYMNVVQNLTGSGGWPLTVFLTSDLLPFFAGTYFPPVSVFGKPGLRQVLEAVNLQWTEERSKVKETAKEIVNVAKSGMELSISNDFLDLNRGKHYSAQLPKMIEQLSREFDVEFGGFGNAPKFPRPAVLSTLFYYYYFFKDDDTLNMATVTLDKMAKGGIHDHLGGGFHRYSVDRFWRVPHFEKMLYDQAQLLITYCIGYQLTKNNTYASVADKIIKYVLNQMESPHGGFYSAEDADSLLEKNGGSRKQEGVYYMWTYAEIMEGLGVEEGEQFIRKYGIEKTGNTISDPHHEFADRNVLYINEELEIMPSKWALGLLEILKFRPRPLLDDKIIAAWNGYMISGLALSARVLDRSEPLQAAIRAADFLWNNLVKEGVFYRRFCKDEAKYDAGLLDYAAFINGLLDLYEASGQYELLEKCLVLAEKVKDLFVGSEGIFFDTAADQVDLIIRSQELTDGAEPSGTSMTCIAFFRLGRLLASSKWVEIAERALLILRKVADNWLSSTPLLLMASDYCKRPARQIIISGSWSETKLMRSELGRYYLPNSVIVHLTEDSFDWWAQKLPMVNSMKPISKPTVYICKDFTCELPIESLTELTEKLSRF